MNSQPNDQPMKKLVIKKQSIRILGQGQNSARPTTQGDEPTQYCTFPC